MTTSIQRERFAAIERADWDRVEVLDRSVLLVRPASQLPDFTQPLAPWEGSSWSTPPGLVDRLTAAWRLGNQGTELTRQHLVELYRRMRDGEL